RPMSSMTVPTTTQHAELVAQLPELRAMLEEQRRFRLEQLSQLNDQYAQSQLEIAGRHVDSLDTSADNARVEVSAAVEAAPPLAPTATEPPAAGWAPGGWASAPRRPRPLPPGRLSPPPRPPVCMPRHRPADHRR